MRLETIYERLDSGYYDRPEVMRAVVGGLKADLCRKPPRPSYAMHWILGAVAVALAALAYFVLRG
jgi:hypothetical protein